MVVVPLPTIRRWVKQLSPDTPMVDPDDPRYVDFDKVSLRGTGGSPIHQMARVIALGEPTEKSCQLFSGFPGTGKTTELHRLGPALADLEGRESHVVFIDGEAYLDRYAPPSITDLLRVFAWHLDAEADRAEGKDPTTGPGYLQRFWNWLQSDVEISNVGMGAYGVNLMAEIKSNPTFREKVETQLKLRFQAFAKEAHEVIHAAIARIRKATGVARVVVVVDGLEKFTALRPEDEGGMEASVEAVFCSHASWLRFNAHIVYTFPLWLKFRRSDLGTLYDDEPFVLPMIKVSGMDGAPHEPGIAKMTEMICKRFDDVAAALGPDPAAVLRPAVLASGGYPRDLLRLVRNATQRTTSFPIPPSAVESAVDRLAEDYARSILRSEPALLAWVARNHALPAGEEEVRKATRLFALFQVLTFRNGQEWFDVHPMVRRSGLVRAMLDAPQS